MGLFDLNTTPAVHDGMKGGSLPVAAVQPRMIVAKRKAVLEEALQQFGDSGHDVHFISNGDWNLFDFFNLALGQFDGPCHVWLSTYAIYEFPLRQILLAQQAGQVTMVKMLIDSRARIRNESSLALAKNIANKIALRPCHAKVLVMQNESRTVVLVGSQNWTKNPRIEVGFISASKALAAFHVNWIEKVLEGANAFE